TDRDPRAGSKQLRWAEQTSPTWASMQPRPCSQWLKNLASVRLIVSEIHRSTEMDTRRLGSRPSMRMNMRSRSAEGPLKRRWTQGVRALFDRRSAYQSSLHGPIRLQL